MPTKRSHILKQSYDLAEPMSQWYLQVFVSKKNIAELIARCQLEFSTMQKQLKA